MGRLFWKFFLFIWLAQLAGVLGTGALFWLERQQLAGQGVPWAHPAPPPDDHQRRPPPEFSPGQPPPGGRPPGRPLPVLPIVVGLVVSLFCAAGLAWYIAKPIRQLRKAFDRAADGDLEVRVTPSMGGRRDELTDLGRDFDRMSGRLQEVLEGQQRLLHDVSHEMRSPLARLQAAIGLARQQPARMEDSLRRIEREGERMDRLVGELLTLSRFEVGAAALPEAVDVGELLQDVVEDARFEGGPRQVSVVYEPGPPSTVRADGELLQRAIENVVRNAVRHSPEGGEVRVSVTQEGTQWLLIRVADQGDGVPEAQLEAIFQPFFRGEGSASKGHGLGLSIARRAIAAFGGTIRASRGGERGLLVTISLPVAEEAVTP